MSELILLEGDGDEELNVDLSGDVEGFLSPIIEHIPAGCGIQRLHGEMFLCGEDDARAYYQPVISHVDITRPDELSGLFPINLGKLALPKLATGLLPKIGISKLALPKALTKVNISATAKGFAKTDLGKLDKKVYGTLSDMRNTAAKLLKSVVAPSAGQAPAQQTQDQQAQTQQDTTSASAESPATDDYMPTTDTSQSNDNSLIIPPQEPLPSTNGNAGISRAMMLVIGLAIVAVVVFVMLRPGRKR